MVPYGHLFFSQSYEAWGVGDGTSVRRNLGRVIWGRDPAGESGRFWYRRPSNGVATKEHALLPLESERPHQQSKL